MCNLEIIVEMSFSVKKNGCSIRLFACIRIGVQVDSFKTTKLYVSI